MTAAELDISRFLAEMHAKLDALERERTEIAARTQAIEARERSLEQTWERKYAARIREVEQQAARLSTQFEQRAQDTIEELSQKARAKIAKTKREYIQEVAAILPEAQPAKTPQAPRLKLEQGARVRLKGIRQPATVRRLLTNGLVEVDAGFLKMQVPESDVEEILPPADTPVRRTDVSFHQGPSFDASYREINVVGQRAESACEQVDKMLDNAALAQVEKVRIIHGHGMGILKRAVAELLKQNPHVEKFYTAPPEEGGSGSTIVELK
jgi:DNA mismatch repair protein MutS2